MTAGVTERREPSPVPAVLRQVFGAFPSGVTVLAAQLAEHRVGMAASSFTSVSLEPPLVSVCASAQSRTWQLLRRARRIGVSVLADTHEQVSRQLAAKDGDRFAGLSWRSSDDGALYLEGAAAWLDCSVDREIEAGDHSIVLLKVHQLAAEPAVDPLVFHASKYRRLAP